MFSFFKGINGNQKKEEQPPNLEITHRHEREEQDHGGARGDEMNEDAEDEVKDDALLVPVVSDVTQPRRDGNIEAARAAIPPPSPASRLEVVLKSSPARSHLTPAFGSETATPSSAATPLDSTGMTLQPKRKGRPPGWKPGMSYAAMRGDPPPRDWRKYKDKVKKVRRSPTRGASGSEQKRRGRPPKPPDMPAREFYLRSDPKFNSFGCEWHGPDGQCCPAQLQNMETLRKHVYVIHGDMDQLICRWAKCARRQRPPEFVDEVSFRKHMEKVHLMPYMWHMGDGPQNNGLWTVKRDSDKLPAYLCDENGVQITPSVKDQQLEDTPGHLERKRRLRELRLIVDANAPDEEEFLRQTLYGVIPVPSEDLT